MYMKFLLGGTALALMPLGAAMAQTNSNESAAEVDDASGLDVIVVTAQKRSQNLQDVPVSVAALSGEAISDAGILQLSQLAEFVPGFSVNKIAIGDKINIRGVQSGDNAGLEQSVATFVDGVYRGRGVQSRFAFLDVGRVEVLRGPQGALFGKNTIGGAINIATARPTNDLSVGLSGTYTFDNVEEYDIEGHISGPISERIRVRAAGKYNNLADGFIEDLFHDDTSPRSEEWAGRLSVEVDLSETTQLFARVDFGDFDISSQGFTQITPGPLALFGVPASLSQSLIGSINPVLDIGSPGTFRGDTFEAAISLEQEIGDHTLTVIAAHSKYDFLRECDCDFSPLDIVRFDDSEDFEQTSVEVRLVSPQGRTLEYLVGGYYQTNSLLADGLAQFNVRGTGAEVGADTLLNLGCDLAVGAGADPATDRSCILAGLIEGFDGTPLAYPDFGRLHILDQESELFSVFGQGTWNFTDQFALTVGLNYARETKDAVQSAFPTIFGTRTRDDATTFGNFQGTPFAALAPFITIGEGTPHTFILSRTENSLTWSANLAYQPNSDILLYAKVATGFKSGGFNSFALSDDPDEAEFEPERAIGGELGGKFTILNGNGEINVAAFYSNFEDLQTALFTGSTSFIVQNAAEATTRGVEIDSRFAVGDNLQLRASVSYVDFAFDSFPNAGCTVDQVIAFRISTGNPLATTQNCAAAEVNDLAGRPSENTPRWSGSFGATHELPIGKFVFTNNIAANFASSQFREADLDPALEQEAFIKFNWVATFGPKDGIWDLSLIANNIFNKRTFSFGNDTPLIDTARQIFPDRPRTIGVRARVKI